MSRLLYAALAVAVLGLAAAAGYWFGMSHPQAPSPGSPAAEGGRPDRKVLYWYDPMYPQQRFDKPGKSPFMDMMLVPKYADAGGDESGVSISPRVVQNLGVRTAEARAGSLAPKLAAVGNVEYNERAVVLVQTRTAGFVEKLHVRAPLDPVREGQPLVEILFPDWAARAGRVPRAAATRRSRRRAAAARRARAAAAARHDRGANRRGRAGRHRAGARRRCGRRCPAWSPSSALARA